MARHPRVRAATPVLTALVAVTAALAAPGPAVAVVQRPAYLQEDCAASTLQPLASRLGPDGMRASLRLGLCRLREGRAREAVRYFDRGLGHATLAAYALLWGAQASLAAGDPVGARLRAERALRSGLPAASRVQARLVLSESWRLLGDPEVAWRHARAALRDAEDRDQRAAAWGLLGRAAEAAGRAQEAKDLYTVAWWGYPGTAAAHEAEAHLRRLRGRLPPPTALARAERAGGLRHPPEALAEWKAALQGGLSGEQAGEAWLQVGLLGGGPEGLAALRRAAAYPRYRLQADYWTGVLLARTGRLDQAKTVWHRLVSSHPRSPWAARALTALARQAEASGEFAAADRYWAQVAHRFPDSEFGPRAAWARGWLRYRLGRYTEAERMWQQAAAHFPGSPWAAASLYWEATSRARRGLDAGAALRHLAEQYPHTYYGQRARQRLSLPPPPPPPEPQPLPLPAGGFAPAAVELAALGAYAEAAEEALAREPSGLLRRVAAWARAQAGDLAGSVAVAEAAVASARAQSGSADGALWRLSYPLAYREVVWRWSQAAGVDPLLVLAVVREESRFRADAVSWAGAVGLMQLLPSTARELDPSVGPQALTEPEVNVRLATAYLAGRLREFRGDLLLALVAYNAGPAAARRFSALRTRGDDEFVERIPYPETRAYVKRVLESYGVYRWLYGHRR